MKTALAITIILLITQTGRSQTAVTDSANPLFKGELDGDRIRLSYDYFEPYSIQDKPKGPYNTVVLSMFPSKSLYAQTALNPKEHFKELDPFAIPLKKGHTYGSFGNYPNRNAVPLFDSIPVIVTAYGINETNKNIYRFRVLLDGQKELVPWREPRLFSPTYIGFRYNADGTEEKQMAYLGEFTAPVGHSITVEVRNLKLPDTAYKISAVWIKRAPAVIGTFGPETFKDLIQVYKYQWKYDFERPHASTYYGDIDLQPVDSLLRNDSIFDHTHDNLFFYLKDKVKAMDLVEYNLVKDKDSSGWQANTFDPNLIWLRQLTPGNYSLLLRYAFQRQTIATFRFQIKKAWYQTFLFKLLLISIAITFIGLLYSFFKSQNQRKILRQQQIRRQQAEVGLRSIRSQFNPHFVFNALNSIQGLIRKGDTENADKYLSNFSSLMRESLRAANTEVVSLDKELKMLESYIALEKLRFNFSYTVSISDKINIHTTEIPTLLLQPLIENAIKHGISGMYEKGLLRLEVATRGNDLQIEIVDNGEGFDPTTISGGYGIQLTKERNQLLSDLHPGQPVSLAIHSGAGGTKAIILFKNWLI